MNWAHVHLLLNHIPVLGIPVGLLLLAAGAFRRSRDLVAAGLWTFLLIGLLVPAVYLTGEPAEDVVEGHPGVSKPMIEEHEEAAAFALGAALALGALAAVGLVLAWRRGGAPRSVVLGAIALAVVASLIMLRTANLGGQVRHDEIRGGSPAAAAGGEPEEKDDD